jgi:hypothetical protein
VHLVVDKKKNWMEKCEQKIEPTIMNQYLNKYDRKIFKTYYKILQKEKAHQKLNFTKCQKNYEIMLFDRF